MTLEELPQKYFCETCNAGPFTKLDKGSLGKSIYDFHESHNIVDYKEPEPTLSEIATQTLIENSDEMLAKIKEFFGSLKNDVFKEIADILEKEVKDERNNIIQVAITILSAYTRTPQNLRIIAPSGEGKTYIVTKVSALFPEDNIITLANATPQSFKYLASKKIVEVKPGIWKDYNEVAGPIFEGKNGEDGTFPKLTAEDRKKLDEIHEKTFFLLDFTNKTIIFLDNQSFGLWEELKTTLSHDKEYSKRYTANKSKSGQLSTSKIVFKGWPAVIYCSAKDEISQDKTDEINTRFNTISIKGKPEKYKDILKIQSLKSSLPKGFYQKKIVSDEEIDRIKTKIQLIIDMFEKYSEDDAPVANLYAEAIADQFQTDAGYRARQLKNLLANINVITLARARARPKLVINNKTYPITIKNDIELANNLTYDLNPLPTTKLQFFNEYIRPAFAGTIDNSLSALALVELIRAKNPKIGLDRQKLRERYLNQFVDHGYLDEEEDPNNASRHVYHLVGRYKTEKADFETSLIVTHVIEDSCVNLYKEKWLSDVLDWKIIDKNEKLVVDYRIDQLQEEKETQKNQLIEFFKNVTDDENSCLTIYKERSDVSDV